VPGLKVDILIVGGTAGGVAAALSAARLGRTCILSESSEWIGGQLTAQAVPPDENQWVETFGATRTYQAFREAVRRWYRANRPLVPAAREAAHLNPGGGWVSRLCCEPRVAHEVLLEMIAGPIRDGLLRVLTRHVAIGVSLRGYGERTIGSVTLRDQRSGACVEIEADWVLDATDLGDLLPLARAEHLVGAESSATHGEMHGREDLPAGATDALDQQAFSWCFAIEHCPGENHIGDPPDGYAFWRSYVPEMDRPWPGPLLSWEVPSHNETGRVTLPLVPWPDEPRGGEWELWRYRRISDRAAYEGDDRPPDVCLVNWVQMDHWLAPLVSVDGSAEASAEVTLRAAREQSRCLLHWMQTEAPRHDDQGIGYPGLRLRGDELGTADGFAMAPYIREGRRLMAVRQVHEGHIGTEQRCVEGRARLTDGTPCGTGEPFWDTVGIGHYHIDLHSSCAGRNSVYVPAAPFRIPLSALVPVRLRNLLASGKCIGVTHIANGAFRMHPVEWNVGEAAGLLAAWCSAERTEPHAILGDQARLREFQATLCDAGVRLTWPWEEA
jgi:hypothetical protein